MQAFVSRSFNPDDNIITSRFIKLFNSIQSLQPNFTWIDAEASEAERLLDKIAPKINKSEIFIAICTRKEKVVKKESFFGNEYEYKTSDWIIQEIGYAVAKEKKIILLVEKDVRTPLEMKLEYERIYFKRNDIEEAVNKIHQMLGSVLFFNKGQEQILLTKNTQENVKDEEISIPLDNIEKQKLDTGLRISLNDIDSWSEEIFEQEIIEAIKTNNTDLENQIAQTYYNKFCKIDPIKGGVFQSKIFREKKDILSLKMLLKKHPTNPDIHRSIANVYDIVGNYNAAFDHYFKSYENYTDPNLKLFLLVVSTIMYVKSGRKDFSQYIEKMIQIDAEDINKHIYVSLSHIFEILKKDFLYTLALEGIINEDPLASNIEFKLAHKYTSLKNNELAYHHYKTNISHDKDDSSSWNNLGVVAFNLNLKGKSISAYRQAEKLGRGIAIKNIADVFLENGFLDEAKEICKNNIQYNSTESNLYNILSRITEKIDYENEEEEKIIKGAKERQSILLKLSKSLLPPIITKLPYKYKHLNLECILENQIKENEIRFSGVYKTKGIFSGLTNVEPSFINYSLEIAGEFYGRLIIGEYKKTKLGDESKDITQVFLSVSEDFRTIEVYDKEKLEKIFELTAVEGA